MKMLNRVAVISILIGMMVTLTACTQVSEENFNKVQVGMTMDQVTAILGPSTRTESVNFMGFSGTTAVWRSQTTEITILFFNDKVQVKGLKQIQDLKPNQFQVPFNKVDT